MKENQLIPLFSSVQAGFPSPADDFIEERIDLNKYLITHPAATFFVKVEGSSMIDANIYPGDILIVDRAELPSNRKIVVAVVNGEFTVKRISIQNNKSFLVSENKKIPPISITADDDCRIWGVVTYIIHKAK